MTDRIMNLLERLIVSKIVTVFIVIYLTSCSSKIYLNQPYAKTKADMKIFFDTYNKKIQDELREEEEKINLELKNKKPKKPKPAHGDDSTREISDRLNRDTDLTSSLNRRLPNLLMNFKKIRLAKFHDVSEKYSYWRIYFNSPLSKQEMFYPEGVWIRMKPKGRRRSKIIIDSFKQGLVFKERYYGTQFDWAKKVYNYFLNRSQKKK